MNQKNILQAFINEDKPCKAGNVKYDGNSITHFYTTIAQRHEGKIVVNSTKYSSSTSKLQTYVRSEIHDFIEVTGVPIGKTDLVPYIKEDE